MNEARNRSENRTLLGGIPILVAATLIGWFIWRANANLDDIEERVLSLRSVGRMAWDHLVIVVISAVAVVITAVPLGVFLTRSRTKFLAPWFTALANVGQSAPVVGVVLLFAIWLGFSRATAVISLWIYAFLPVLANVITGLRGVDRTLVEAALGQSMAPRQVLLRVELPLAMPVIMEGIRTSLVLLVGAGAFGAFIDAGGLGELITTGINLYRFPILISGALLVAALALMVEWVGRFLEEWLTPKGVA